MKKSVCLLIFLLMVFFTHCGQKKAFDDMVRDTMKIEYVFPIPTNAYKPGMIVYYSPSKGYQRVCTGENLLEMTEEEYNAQLKPSDIPDLNGVSSSNLSIDLNLDAGDKAKMTGDLQRAKQILIELKNGKLIELKDDVLAAIMENLNKKENVCRRNMKARKALGDERTFLVSSVYAYDINYVLVSDTNAKINAELTPQAEEVIKTKLSKVNMTGSAASTSGFGFKGNQLYIGFNGEPNIAKLMNSGSGSFNSLKSRLSSGGKKPDLRVIDISNVFKD